MPWSAAYMGSASAAAPPPGQVGLGAQGWGPRKPRGLQRALERIQSPQVWVPGPCVGPPVGRCSAQHLIESSPSECGSLSVLP